MVTVSFIGGGNRSNWRKPLTCRESLTNFISRIFNGFALIVHIYLQIYLPGLIFNTYPQNSDIVFVQEHKSVVVILELRSNGKVWLARNQDNESEWNNMSTYGLLFQWASTNKNPTKCVGSVQGGHHHHHQFSLLYSWNIAQLALNNNHSHTVLI